MLLGFGATIAHAAEAVEAHGAGQRIARFALVQFRSGTPAQLRIAEPVEHQQGALNAADFAQRQGEAILPRIGAEPTRRETITIWWVALTWLWSMISTSVCAWALARASTSRANGAITSPVSMSGLASRRLIHW